MPVYPYLYAMAEIGIDLQIAENLLKAGKLVAIPTETVYGLAGDALNENAVLSIFQAKQRPFFDPLIVHVANLSEAAKYADLAEPKLKALAEHFWPGPLTILFPKKAIIPDLVTSGLPRLAIRVPNHPLSLQLLKNSLIPLAAPSANPFGYVSPTTAQHVNKQLGDKIDYILDGGPCQVGLESTIVGLEEGQICVYRLGGLSLEELEKVAGTVELRLNVSSDPKAPGQLKNHYAPRKPLYLGDVEALAKTFSGKKIAAITYTSSKLEFNCVNHFVLTEKNNDQEAAINLFRYLREADDSEAEVVIADRAPNKGLGLAINDRLQRAATQ